MNEQDEGMEDLTALNDALASGRLVVSPELHEVLRQAITGHYARKKRDAEKTPAGTAPIYGNIQA